MPAGLGALTGGYAGTSLGDLVLSPQDTETEPLVANFSESEFGGDIIKPEEPFPGDEPPFFQKFPDVIVPEAPGPVSPGAVPMRGANWDERRSPPTYRLANGDTFAGLAATYLGTSTRWLELYEFQDESFRSKRPDPSQVFVGDVINMPPDAHASFVLHTTCPDESPEPVPGGKASPLPSNVPTPTCIPRGRRGKGKTKRKKKKRKPKRTGMIVAGIIIAGGLGAAVLGRGL